MQLAQSIIEDGAGIEGLPRSVQPVAIRMYMDEHLYNIQCSEIFTLRIENLHTEA